MSQTSGTVIEARIRICLVVTIIQVDVCEAAKLVSFLDVNASDSCGQARVPSRAQVVWNLFTVHTDAAAPPSPAEAQRTLCVA